jgi:hypothetical protein
MEKISYLACVNRIKRLIASIKGIDWTDLKVSMVLKDSPIRFTTAGLRAMAKRLNAEFQEYNLKLKPNETASEDVETLGDLCSLVWDKLPAEVKES